MQKQLPRNGFDASCLPYTILRMAQDHRRWQAGLFPFQSPPRPTILPHLRAARAERGRAIFQTANRAAGRGWWRHSWFSDPYVLLRWAMRTMVLHQPLPVYAPVTVQVPGVGELQGAMRALVASSLAMRNALYNPFAERGSGAVRLRAAGPGNRALPLYAGPAGLSSIARHVARRPWPETPGWEFRRAARPSQPSSTGHPLPLPRHGGPRCRNVQGCRSVRR